MLKLIKPSEGMLSLIKPYIEEYRNDNSPFKNNGPKKLVAYYDDGNFKGYVENLRYNETSDNLPNGYVNSTTYWLMDGNKHVGIYDVRHKLTPRLMQIGGHIAYTIVPSQRGKGYAVEGVKLCLKELKKLGEQEALITCDASNELSFKVIKKAISLFGGRLLEDSFVDGHKEHRGFVNTDF